MLGERRWKNPPQAQGEDIGRGVLPIFVPAQII